MASLHIAHDRLLDYEYFMILLELSSVVFEIENFLVVYKNYQLDGALRSRRKAS